MLLEFGFKNYFSFLEGATVSFKLDANCPTEVSAGHDFTQVIGIKGANASGKTQILKALSFVSGFCANSFSDDPDDPITLFRFYDNPEPSEFYVEFQKNGNFYRYELVATDVEVVRETLYRTKKRQVKIFERIKNEITYTAKNATLLKYIILRKNASIISTTRQHKISIEEMGVAWDFFNFIQTNVSFAGLRESIPDINKVSKFLFDNPEIFKFVKSFICECDNGISDIEIIPIEDPDNQTKYSPVFIHKHNGKPHPVTAITESSGTKALYRNLASYYIALKFGKLVIEDEIDRNLHPFLLSKIIDLFLNEETNPDGAQLIFSTHNTEVMDQLGRYRTYLVNKVENQSFAYRLDEIPGDILRNDRAISPSYKSGKIGGVPRL